MIKAALACLLGKQLQGRPQPEGKPERENITAPGFKEGVGFFVFLFFKLNFHQQPELTPHHR